MDHDRDNMSASGVVDANEQPATSQRPRRRTFDVLGDEPTQVVWHARANKKRSLAPIVAAAIIGVVVSGALMALLLFKSADEDPGQPTAEDPLALYQVATELYEQGEYNAALQMLKRAREVTTHSRAHKQLNALERDIKMALSGKPRQPASAVKTPEATPSGEASKPPSAKNNGRSRSRSVRVTRSRGRSRTASRGRNVGMIFVESDAVGDVLVDGRPTGSRTPTTLSLAPGKHTIEVVPLIDPSMRMVRQVHVIKGQADRVRLALAEGRPNLPHKTAAEATTGRTESHPGIGTVGETKPAIGTVGSGKPTIGIIKGQ